jgi:hypothetical protein
MPQPGLESSVGIVEEKVRPHYEKPRIQSMSEREILNTFQITQAMTTWWAAC